MDRLRRKRAGTRRVIGVKGREKERGMEKKTVAKREGAVGVRGLVETEKRTAQVREIGKRKGVGAAETVTETVRKTRMVRDMVREGSRDRDREKSRDRERREREKERERREREAVVDLEGKRGNVK